eukprot:CAMPEP_0115340688 /NCGR_PEP_ID=MMETSP0270-20121206/91277_1 /TAXON_ID=71861 /ORGANISM="Scrippsiella trochoidea, Strain CCMP3099" /LENGTH=990 /DNA_ID=CAMNT_0002762153 /DNA_START=9 /DNA_END=2978 /DNA_ORIENTATION=+
MLLRIAALSLCLIAAARPAAGGLPPYTKALGDYLWKRATKDIEALGKTGYEGQEKYVCGAGNWGDGPQCNQWDHGYSPCWPSAMTVSAAWDIELMELWSEEMAEEFGVTGRGQLGPGINLARFAWNGRLGEYMSGEDPYFGAKMVGAMVTAYRRVPHPPLQTAKHFIPNTIEKDRNHVVEEVDERTLFEVYYPPFQAAVDAGVSAVMCSYNLVKCTTGKCSGIAAYACANGDILNRHLKSIMGFKGMVVSDWDATKCQDAAANTAGCSQGAYIDNDFAAENGLDLEMPSCISFKGGVTKRAQEKAVRMQWAYLMQGRNLDGDVVARQLQGSPTVKSLQWKNHPEKCFQVEGEQPVNGMKLLLQDCSDSSAGQQFIWSGADSKIHWAAHPKMCIDVTKHDFTNGVAVQLWECIEDDSDQLFTIPADGMGKIRSVNHPEMCLDVTGHFTWNGNPIQIWECIASDDDQILSTIKVKQATPLAPAWSVEAPASSSGAATAPPPPAAPAPAAAPAAAAPAPSWNTGVYKDNPFGPSKAKSPAPAPSWSTGVYKDNPFGPSAAKAPSPEAVKAGVSSGGLPTKADGPKRGVRCKDEGGDNYKNKCKLALADRIIAESTTILKNERDVLPLSKQTNVALIGKQACTSHPIAQGGGSGWNGFACNEVPKINVADGIAGVTGGAKPSCPAGSGPDNPAATNADVIVAVVTPAKASEGTDRPSLQLDADDVAVIKKYSQLGKKVVVAMTVPGPVITSTWDANVAAIAISWLPGQQDGRGIALALYGEDYEASGRLPFTFPKCSTEQCTQADELASVHLGDKIASGQYLKFEEKALIGYRWYHAQGLQVSYPFGFGLFAYGSATVAYTSVAATFKGDDVEITATLSHSGPRAGRDVPQLYLKFPASIPGDAASKPEWVLKGFTKVLVEPGKPATAGFSLSVRDVSYWDDGPGQSKWVCAQGTFKACVGANARDAILDEAACTTFAPRCPAAAGGATVAAAP